MTVSAYRTTCHRVAALKALDCAAGESPSGAALVSVYALHDEPLPIADGVCLDPGYPAFLQVSPTHSHARVSWLARRALTGIGIAYPISRKPTDAK